MNKAEYMTVEETAVSWKVSPERITYTCEQNGINGVAKLSGQWIIPKGIPRPVIKQIPRPPRKPFEGQGNRTRVQQALIDAFECNDAVPFSVSEQKIGSTTFIVTSCYSKSARQTIPEAFFSFALRELEREQGLCIDYSKREETLRKIRKEEIEKQPSVEEYICKIKDSLFKMGFCEEDITMLLEKYAEAYRPLEER